MGFELANLRFEVQRSTMKPKGKRHFCNENLSISIPYLSGSTSDFKSRGHEFKLRWGQTKIYLKEISPGGILISSYFESLGGLL